MRLLRLLKNDLARETTGWVAEQIISTEQAEKICARYGIDYHNQRRHSYGYFVLVTLGYLFIGLAVITLLSHNWDEIPRGIRMSGLILLTLSVNLVGLYKAKRGEEAAAVGAFFLGSLFYGASIMLIAQIYHIGEHFPDGILWWSLGVLPLALLMRSSLLMILTASLGFIWFFVESSLHFYPTLFVLFLAAMAWHSFRVKQSNILFLACAVGFGFWLEYSFAWLLGSGREFDPGIENFSLVVALFIIYYGVAKWLDGRNDAVLSDYGTLLGLWSLRFAILTLFILSFEDPWEELLRADWNMSGAVLGLTVAFSLTALWLVKDNRRDLVTIGVIATLCTATNLVLIVNDTRALAGLLQVADNVVLIGAGVWLIIRGIQSAISHYFFLGIVTILAIGLVRYIDLVGDYVGASLLFALFAAILLSAARYWRSRIVAGKEVGA